MSAAFTETHNVYMYVHSFLFFILNESDLVGLHSQVKYVKIEVLLLSRVPNCRSAFREYRFSEQVLFLVLFTSPSSDDFL